MPDLVCNQCRTEIPLRDIVTRYMRMRDVAPDVKVSAVACPTCLQAIPLTLEQFDAVRTSADRAIDAIERVGETDDARSRYAAMLLLLAHDLGLPVDACAEEHIVARVRELISVRDRVDLATVDLSKGLDMAESLCSDDDRTYDEHEEMRTRLRQALTALATAEKLPEAAAGGEQSSARASEHSGDIDGRVDPVGTDPRDRNRTSAHPRAAEGLDAPAQAPRGVPAPSKAAWDQVASTIAERRLSEAPTGPRDESDALDAVHHYCATAFPDDHDLADLLMRAQCARPTMTTRDELPELPAGWRCSEDSESCYYIDGDGSCRVRIFADERLAVTNGRPPPWRDVLACLRHRESEAL